MNIQATKIELVKTILEIDDCELIQKVANFVNKERTDFWSVLPLQQQQEIEKGIEELNNGKRISFDDFLTKIS